MEANDYTFQIEIRQLEPAIITTDIIVAEMNKRFRNQEQFECQLEIICFDIAIFFNGRFYENGKTSVFDFINPAPEHLRHLSKEGENSWL